ncbi:MAG TPA: aldolase/citrate lyase family protein [Gammaproteobacteria bacterium]|nr:aldolase/citrate lyase family protein [Gammaproteobacteria bacterium]
MRLEKLIMSAALALLFAAPALAQDSVRLFNTAKAKLLAGERIVGGTVTTSDPTIYCAMATSGYDFLWIEMQHSPLGFQDVARMIWACRDAPAMPFVRVAGATAGDIQKAVDMGVVGIFVPLVDSAEEIADAVRFAKFPPEGERSLGGGQYRALWGNDYRSIANDNILVVAMIESPLGVERVREIAAVEGVDGLFAASTDLGSFSGLRQGMPEYEAMVEEIVAVAEEFDLWLGGPQAWMDRPAFSIFQGPSDTGLLRMGVERSLAESPTGVAEIEGSGD